MGHIHPVTDGDKKHFVIDPITRLIKNETSKIVLIKEDHNSERFTFEIPRFVEGHDMSVCDKIDIHYISIDGKTRKQNSNVYEVIDAKHESINNEEKVLFSWLVSNNVTKYAGSLNFAIRFACTDDNGTIVYSWNTAIFSGITISDGINNTEIAYEEISDILQQWWLKIEALSENLYAVTADGDIVNLVDKFNKITELETKINTNINDISALEDTVGSNTGRITELEGKVNPSDERISTLETKVSKNTTDISDLNSNALYVNNKLITITDDLNGLEDVYNHFAINTTENISALQSTDATHTANISDLSKHVPRATTSWYQVMLNKTTHTYPMNIEIGAVYEFAVASLSKSIAFYQHVTFAIPYYINNVPNDIFPDTHLFMSSPFQHYNDINLFVLSVLYNTTDGLAIGHLESSGMVKTTSNLPPSIFYRKLATSENRLEHDIS